MYTSIRKHAFYDMCNYYFFSKCQYKINDIYIYKFNYIIFEKTVKK